MKRVRVSLVTLGMLLAMVLPTQSVGAVTSVPFISPPASRLYFSPAAQLSLFDSTVQPAPAIPWRGGISQPLAGLPNVEGNNPSQDGNSPQRTQAEAPVAIFGSHVVGG